MPLFKVWNADGSDRRLFMASTLKELIDKAREKFSNPNLQHILIHDEHLEIEEDEVLNEVNGVDLRVVAVVDKSSFNCIEQSPSPSSFTDIPTSSPLLSDIPVPNFTPSKIELPTFSPSLHLALEANNSMVFNQALTESAIFYHNKYPNMKDSTYYQAIGKKMIKVYPCLAYTVGTHPWTFFITKLSARLRTLRTKENSKSRATPSTSTSGVPEPVGKRFRMAPIDVSDDLEATDYDKHLEELAREWRTRRTDGHVKLLLQKTRQKRTHYISTLPSGEIVPILKAFPCFEEGRYILNEFFLMRNKEDPEKARMTIVANMEWLCSMVATQELKAVSDVESSKQIIESLQKRVCVDKGKGAKSKTVLTVHEVDDISDVPQKILFSKEKEAPCLKILVNNNIFQAAYVVGDGAEILCQTNNIMDSVIVLIAVYYVCDLCYPETYSQFLGLIQEWVLNDPFGEKRGSNFVKFHKLLTAEKNKSEQ